MNAVGVVTAGVSLAGAAAALAGLAARVSGLQDRPFRGDAAPAKGSAARGVAYALTLGLAPWAKESTRRHFLAYVRGILLHLGIFVGLAWLVASPWRAAMPPALRIGAAAVMALGAAMALAGFGMRLREPGLRLLSTWDDYMSLGLVTVFLVLGAASAAAAGAMAAFWVLSGMMLAYLPWGKLRHFIYFVYTRTFFGLLFGRRGILEAAR